MLSLNRINLTYGDGTRALDNVSLQLPGGMIGLLGPNGAGKTTLMRTLACLQTPDSGDMRFDGIDLEKQPAELRRCLGYLPQQFGVYPNMSCQALMEHLAILKRIPKAQRDRQIEELLALTNLSDVRHKPVSRFSGGMRQRFGIAQALLGDPRFIIMDEPTAGLDPRERERLHDVLVSISRNKLVLLSTHIVEDIENLCHHVAFLMRGRILDSNPVRQLIAPLEGRIWQSRHRPAREFRILSKSHRFGEPCYRIYSADCPGSDAQSAEATLQDRYFLELSKVEEGNVGIGEAA